MMQVISTLPQPDFAEQMLSATGKISPRYFDIHVESR